MIHSFALFYLLLVGAPVLERSHAVQPCQTTNTVSIKDSRPTDAVLEPPNPSLWRAHQDGPYDDTLRRLTYDSASNGPTSVVQLPNGHVILADQAEWSSDSLYYHKVEIRRSTDGCQTWSAPESVPTDGYTPSLLHAQDGGLWLFLQRYDSATSHLCYMRSTDEGYTWSAESPIQARTESKNAIYSVQAADGRIMVFYGLYVGYPANRDIYYHSSSDNGSTWTGEVALVADTGDQYLGSVVRSGTGRMYAFYCSAHYPTDTALNYVSSTDNGQTWSSPSRVVGWRGPGYSAATFDQNGDLSVAFTRSVSENGYNNDDVFWTRSTDDGVTWSEPSRVTTYAGKDYVDDLLAVDGSPWVFIRSDRWMNWDIYYGPLNDLGDPNPPPYVVAEATDPAGPHLRGSFAVQALCAAGTGIDSITMVYTVDGVGQPDVALFDDGNHGDRGAGDGWYGNYVGPFSPGHNTQALCQYRVHPTAGAPFLMPEYPSYVDICGVHDIGNVELYVDRAEGRDGEPTYTHNYPGMEWPTGSGIEYLWGGHTNQSIKYLTSGVGGV